MQKLFQKLVMSAQDVMFSLSTQRPPEDQSSCVDKNIVFFSYFISVFKFESSISISEYSKCIEPHGYFNQPVSQVVASYL